METIMEHVSYETNIDPSEIRMTNINNPVLKEMVKNFISKNKLKDRTNSINLFNKVRKSLKIIYCIFIYVYKIKIIMEGGGGDNWIKLSIIIILGWLAIQHILF